MRVAIGTRVVLVGSREGDGAGAVVAIRSEPWLRPFVIEMDDGRQVFASAAQLAREQDATRTPLGPKLHDD